jgi:hypothetical protein
MFLQGFCLSVLAAIGLDYWKEKFDRKILIPVGIVFVLFVLIFGIHQIFKIETNIKQVFLGGGLLFVSAATIIILNALKKEKALFLLIVILVFDLLYYFLKFNPFVPGKLVFPDTGITEFLQKHNSTRTWGYSAANIEPNFQTYYGIYSPEGYDPLYPKWYGEYLYSSRDGKLLTKFDETTRSQAVISNGYAESDFTTQKARLTILNQTGVGLILNRTESGAGENAFAKSLFTNIYNKDGWSVFENKSALPRVYLSVNNAVSKKGRADIVISKPNRVQIRTNSSVNSQLILLDTYFPGWEAEVDGKNTPILKHNHTFRAVPVSAGQHTVTFIYKPSSFYFGLILTIIGILGTIEMFFTVRKK